jgi:uncharacterized protein (UPF0332 family)
MDLNDCKRKGFVKKARVNPELARSLIEMSNMKEKVVKNIGLNENNVSAFLPMAYDSLREILEAICIMHGYKVTSHVCVEKYLGSVYPKISFMDFDRFRYVRNSINYYGKMVEFEQGKEIIRKIFILKKEFLIILKELLEEIK